MPGSVGPRGRCRAQWDPGVGAQWDPGVPGMVPHCSTYEWEYSDTQAYMYIYIERSASHLLNLGFVVQCGNSVDIVDNV